MIEPELLKQLGWSDELIGEVTREATPLRDAGAHIVSPMMPVTFGTGASTSVYYDESLDSSTQGLCITQR